jgi:hypothetical protein
MTVVPHRLYFSLFLLLKIQLKGRHFDTIDAIEAEHYSRMHLKWQKLWERCIREEGDYFEGDGGQ